MFIILMPIFLHPFFLLFLSLSLNRASSVLQKNSKLYGPKNVLDYENTSTSWNSDGLSSVGTRQQQQQQQPATTFLILEFNRLVHPCELRIQFQAGFVAEKLHVFLLPAKNDSSSSSGSSSSSCTSADSSRNQWQSMAEFDVDDNHDLQIFSLLEENQNTRPTTAVKLLFEDCTDFYGRVIIYQLQIWGYEVKDMGLSL